MVSTLELLVDKQAHSVHNNGINNSNRLFP